jgi:hypothetical protein
MSKMPTPHPNKLTGTRHYGVITVKYTASYFKSANLWHITVTDHLGEVSNETAEDPWRVLPEMIDQALETSRKALQELAAS